MGDLPGNETFLTFQEKFFEGLMADSFVVSFWKFIHADDEWGIMVGNREEISKFSIAGGLSWEVAYHGI